MSYGSHRNCSNWQFLAEFYGLAVVWGIRNVHFWEPSPLDWLVPVAMCVALGWWAVLDSERRGRPILLLARPWFVLFAGLLAPAYVIQSRGWRGFRIVILQIFGWYAVASMLMHAGGTAVFGQEWWRAMR